MTPAARELIALIAHAETFAERTDFLFAAQLLGHIGRSLIEGTDGPLCVAVDRMLEDAAGPAADRPPAPALPYLSGAFDTDTN